MNTQANYPQALPPLSSLIRDAMHPRPAIVEPSHIEVSRPSMSFHHGLGFMGVPMSAAHSSLVEMAGFSDLESPISPRSARIPSFLESISHLTAYTTPSDHGPTTPTSEQESVSPCSSMHTVPGRERVSMMSASGIGPVYRISKSYRSMDHAEEKISKTERRRRNHLNSEKKRREGIKSGMKALFDLVPTCKDAQESKANILKKAKYYILELHDSLGVYQMEIKRLQQENEELRRIIGHPHDFYGARRSYACRL
ncbi:hypothetical protein RUND412_005655 [Rhizina undulata]